MHDKGSLVRELLDKTANDKELVSSYLMKRSRKTHSWKNRWVVLRTCQLSYYKDDSEHKPIKVVPRTSIQTYGKVADSKAFHFAIYTDSKTFHFKAADEATYRKWMEALNVLVGTDKISKNMDIVGAEIEEPGISPDAVDLNNPNCDVSLIPHAVEETYQTTPHNIEEKLRTFSIKNSDEFIVESGYLDKMRGRYNQKKKCFIVLTNRFLYFFKSKIDLNSPSDKVPISEIMDVIERDPTKNSRGWCFLVITPFNRTKLYAPSEGDMIRWLSSLKTLSLKSKQV